MNFVAKIKRAMCPRCKRIVDVKPGLSRDAMGATLVFQTHDIAPMCRQVCNGSGEEVSFEGAGAAADEVVRLTSWLRAIAFTPHLGCDKVPANGQEIIEQVAKANDIHGKGENPNCGTCRAQAALSGREAP